MPAFPGHVVDNHPIGVMKVLDFQQCRRASGFILRPRLPEHQAFAPQRLDPRKLGSEVFEVPARPLLVGQYEFRPDAGHAVGQKRKTLFERASHGRGVEDNIANLFPVIAFVLPADNADGFLKRFAFCPKFAVEGRIREPGDEPVGGMEFIPQPRDEPLAVPVRADTIEFFAHPPAGQIDIVLPDVGQQ